jgi:hypothetical protein
MKRYVRLWRNKILTMAARSLEEMISSLEDALAALQAMRAGGVTLDPQSATADDYAYLVTTDPEVAKKYDMHDEADFLDEEAEDESGEENND